MKIVVVSDMFATKMGYTENILPKALAKQGAEVHVVTSGIQLDLPNYEETYEPFLGPKIQPTGTTEQQGFTLHRLPHRYTDRSMVLCGFRETLRRLRPDIVQCVAITRNVTYQSIANRIGLGYKVFLEHHTHLSVFRQPRHWSKRLLFALYRGTMGRYLSTTTERCYVIGPDVAQIVVDYIGYAKNKVTLCPLGVDTDVFHPMEDAAARASRQTLRAQLGFGPDDVVCVYSGRFSPGKGPQFLAQAVDILQAEHPQFRALFIGSGTEAEVNAIRQCQGAVVHPFVEHPKLGDLYRAADIGVWPKQESMSQLDAAACGLPLILSRRIEVRERVEGNGLLYEEEDSEDLARQILSLADSTRRREMGAVGTTKVRSQFSWNRIAAERICDYEAALASR